MESDRNDHGEPPPFVKWLMWLFRKDTWIKHPLIAPVALIIAVSFTSSAIFAVYRLIPVESANVIPTNAVPIEYTSRLGISIVLSNNSDLPESITGIQLALAQSKGLPRGDMSFQMYTISGEVDYGGSVSGSAETHYEQLPDDSVSFRVEGYLNVTANGWGLHFDVPVQEEIDGNGHFRIVLLLPDSMDLRSPWSDYFSGDSEKVFQLKRLLSNAGPMAIRVTASYGEDKTGTYKGEIEFPTSN